ncbi:antitoxin VbhA family protein [Burkholderia sp. SCN-KJ]|uniref:antitoxin VbhA family protein n=1 Tax=Burkholderia sp. SCN-KJ TaxID=2969248 RepID=UPI00214FC1ED|nr:antitoxin VbhA family protein [Burkholderia sp. SCN-KJ]MCR4471159.1 antitoxin VbhA family protein [Burkholderia sp. SCN-KJ]
MHDERRQAELRERFRQADAISRLEGYEPSEFEEQQKARIVRGEISVEQFVRIMAEHARARAAGEAPASVGENTIPR